MNKIKQQKTLNQKIWNADNSLKPEVLNTLLEIVENFLTNLYLKNNITFEVNEIKDIFLYGSMANYFYTKESDIDICLVLDLSRLRMQNPFININKYLKMCYHEWKRFHNEQIYGYSIDISFDDIYFATHNGRHRVGPQYSLIKKTWNYEPVILSKEEFKKICDQSNDLYNAFLHDYKTIIKSGSDLDQLRLLYKQIYSVKRTMYESNVSQPITPLAIAWRRLRNDGIIDKIRNLTTKKRSEKLSLK